METRTIDWLSLSDVRKAEMINQARNYLQQQVSEERFCHKIAEIYCMEGTGQKGDQRAF